MTLDEMRALAAPDAETGSSRFAKPYWLMSVSLEEAEFLYALVLATRPARVLELGTGLGLTARFIAEALKRNQYGELLTVEPLDEYRAQAVDLLAGLPVSCVPDGTVASDWPDLVYIDSGEKQRRTDLREWFTNGYRGLVVVHDADRVYPEFELGVGTIVPTTWGMWIGRGRP